ncbi:hypothetical protein TorRG33x02_017310 [Trema orientale]|uniref:Uncharacterized protein n=1 Tax=Trema orientale TaxID=63057 RepID=A0A2P5FY85_TREOI|nr:hypothetical protein TorRG33x02_017310 [Trema orientale]
MPGALKLNVDAAVYRDMGFIGIGAIIRDCVGAGLGIFTTRICGRFNDIFDALSWLDNVIPRIGNEVANSLVPFALFF